MLALAGWEGAPLDAVVNVAGGVHRFEPGSPPSDDVFEGCETYLDALAEGVAASAGRADVPALWLYARDDPIFRPAVARRLHAAWRDGGGAGPLVLLPEGEGHRIFLEASGRRRPLPHIDAFLRELGLPTWDGDDFAILRGALAPPQAADLDDHLETGLPMKAMAVPVEGEASCWIDDARSLEAARAEVLAWCEQDSGEPCLLVAENDAPLPSLGTRTGVAPR